VRMLVSRECRRDTRLLGNAGQPLRSSRGAPGSTGARPASTGLLL